MIGPSSSHTAGAARAGLIAGKLLGKKAARADIFFHGSFSHTYKGHGTDRAVIGGILGFAPDDVRLKDSFTHAENAGLEFSFSIADLGAVHPNTVKILLKSEDGEENETVVSSIGGGAVNVIRINGAEVLFSADYNTTVIFNSDRSGVVADVTGTLAAHKINIAFMRLFRNYEGEQAIMVIESDQGCGDEALAQLRSVKNVSKVIYIRQIEN